MPGLQDTSILGWIWMAFVFLLVFNFGRHWERGEQEIRRLRRKYILRAVDALGADATVYEMQGWLSVHAPPRCRVGRLWSASLYPLVHELEREGRLTSEFEDLLPGRRHRRRIYSLVGPLSEP